MFHLVFMPSRILLTNFYGSFSFMVKGKSALWSHLLAFQRECEEVEEVTPTYSQDTNSLSPLAGNDGKPPSSFLAWDWVSAVLRFAVISPQNHLVTKPSCHQTISLPNHLATNPSRHQTISPPNHLATNEIATKTKSTRHHIITLQ